MARIKEQKRKPDRRKRKSVVFIICEGSETEINYFNKFKSRNSLITIKAITSQYKSAHGLVKRAEDTIKQELYSPQDGDELWCVFDRDENTNEELQKAEALAARRGYSVAFSNPSFELWYLLHFADHRANIKDSKAVIAKLETGGYIQNYDKAADYYSILYPNQQLAIDRTIALQNHHASEGLPLLHRNSNPCTTVAKLVMLLQSRADMTGRNKI